MNWKYFIGIDVSKATLNVRILEGKSKRHSIEIENKPKALTAFCKLVSNQIHDFNSTNAMFCMEHTGIYNEHLLAFLQGKKTSICLEHPAHLKLCVGLTREKMIRLMPSESRAMLIRKENQLDFGNHQEQLSEL